MSNKIKNISAKKFLATYAADKNIMVVDVRTPGEVSSENFAGSINLPLQNLEPKSFCACLTENGYDENTPIYILCRSGARAQKAAKALYLETKNPLVIVEGGIQALSQAGAQIEQGTGSVISLDRQVRIAAGSLTLVGVILGAFVHPGFYLISAFIGAGLTFSGLTDSCAMGTAIARMPWNLKSHS